ncbi:hypothetical protein ES711_00930 [Gelidibacter salicanalis]|uniref:Uncharacterized protein n=1 Tax=Gelidibacter salicanalis TaxID=291193 RepID=A0A5C7AR58_9FLAO|nr:hypothetical protein [Gelidibacter salicanalis]TXE10504.1 hypothetical protein ES711_00930 [Gelidibacter salicanalis]
MKTIKKYKLWIDEHSANSAVRSKEQELKKINSGLPTVLRFFDNELSDQEIRELKDYNSIVDKLRPQFPHPSAKDDVNFQLLGKEINGLKDASLILKFINEDYLIKNGKVEISPLWYDANIERFTTYTKNENEIEAYEYSIQLAELLQNGIKKGYISKEIKGGINKVMQFLYLNEDDSYTIQVGRLQQAGQRAEAIKIKADKLKKTA